MFGAYIGLIMNIPAQYIEILISWPRLNTACPTSLVQSPLFTRYVRTDKTSWTYGRLTVPSIAVGALDII